MARNDFLIEEKLKLHIFLGGGETGRNCIPGIARNVCIQPVLKAQECRASKNGLLKKEYLDT